MKGAQHTALHGPAVSGDSKKESSEMTSSSCDTVLMQRYSYGDRIIVLIHDRI